MSGGAERARDALRHYGGDQPLADLLADLADYIAEENDRAAGQHSPYVSLSTMAVYAEQRSANPANQRRSKRRKLSTPWGDVEIGGVGANRRFLLIHNNGGKYSNVEHTTDDVDKAKAELRSWPSHHHASLSVWDAETGEQVT